MTASSPLSSPHSSAFSHPPPPPPHLQAVHLPPHPFSSLKSLVQLLFIPPPSSDFLPIVLLLLIPVLVLRVVLPKRTLKSLCSSPTLSLSSSSEEEEKSPSSFLSPCPSSPRGESNGSKADVVPLPTICLFSVPQPPHDVHPHRHPVPMFLFTPSVGFVDLRRKVMSVPNLLQDTGGIEQPTSSQNSLTFGLSELQQIPTDLWFTRRRIEAGLREQRKQKAMLENVQEQLFRSRLSHAQWRARSLSPPPNSSARSETEPDVIHQRPSTSWARSTDGENRTEFGLRIGQLEQQLEHLQAMASQTLLVHLQQRPCHATSSRRSWTEIRAELIKLRRKLAEHRKDTKAELSEFGNELSDQLAVTLARRMRREWANSMLRRRGEKGGAETAEEFRNRFSLLEAQKTELINTQLAVEHRLEESELRRAALESVQKQIWKILESPTVTEPERLPSAVRTALDAERKRRDTERVQILADAETRDRKRREQHAAELSQRESEWSNERAQLRRELERWRVEAQETRQTMQCRVIELERERTRAEEAEHEAHARAQRAEEMSILVEAQQNRNAQAEAELDAQREKSSELLAQGDLLEAELERAKAELREYRATCEDALKERDELAHALQEANTQRSKALSGRDQLKVQLQEERNDTIEGQKANSDQLLELQARLASAIARAEEADRVCAEADAEVQQQLAETDAELEALKDRLQHAEQRLHMEREARLADAQRSDLEWEEQMRVVAQLQAEKDRVQQRLAEAEQRLQHGHGEHAQADAWRQRVERLQQSLTCAEAETATERRRAEELLEERERRWHMELEHARKDTNRNGAELVELRERETELEERLQDAEYRLGKARELCKKLNAELDELSERSVAQNSSTEQLRAELGDVNGEMVILRKSLEEQRGRNAKLASELARMEKVSVRERELRLKADESFQQAVSEARKSDEKRLSEQRHFQTEREHWKRHESDRQCREQTARANLEEQLRATVDKWTQKIGGIQLVPKRTDAVEGLNQLLNKLLIDCERLEKRTEKAEEEKNVLSAQLSKLSHVQQGDLAALRAKLTKTEQDAKRERVEKVNFEQNLHQRDEAVQRDKVNFESKLNNAKAEHSKAVVKLETEKKTISAALEALRSDNLTLKQQLEAMEEQQQRRRMEKRSNDGTVARLKEAATETALLKAELTRERAEVDRRRSELCEVQRKLSQTLQKAERLQTKLDKAVTERADEQRAFDVLQKRELEWTSLEASMRAMLSTSSSQLRESIQAAESAKRASRETEAVCRELNAQLQRAQRERNAQKQHIEAMEMDRRRVEAVIRQTTLERNALTKSLDAMEAENSELQRHCTALQAQVDRITQGDKIAQKQLEEQQKRVRRLETELSAANRMGQRRKVGQMAKLNRAQSHQQIAPNDSSSTAQFVREWRR
uniref:Trichohyalin n=1 Tax=Globodera rostochiensis TaxID=31243 RepID=A0A914I876_GLORO